MIRTYSELCNLSSFEERFRYLMLGGQVGKETFGFDRFLNQDFYKSEEWKQCRNYVIARDLGRDLGIDGHDIYGKIIVHHMNPIEAKDIMWSSDLLLNPEYLITTVHRTHNAIHYGDESLLLVLPPERTINDTCPWRH